MEATFIAALAGLTSIGAYYFGARTLRLSSARASIGLMRLPRAQHTAQVSVTWASQPAR